jgi:hypothetical protein
MCIYTHIYIYIYIYIYEDYDIHSIYDTERFQEMKQIKDDLLKFLDSLSMFDGINFTRYSAGPQLLKSCENMGQ